MLGVKKAEKRTLTMNERLHERVSHGSWVKDQDPLRVHRIVMGLVKISLQLCNLVDQIPCEARVAVFISAQYSGCFACDKMLEETEPRYQTVKCSHDDLIYLAHGLFSRTDQCTRGSQWRVGNEKQNIKFPESSKILIEREITSSYLNVDNCVNRLLYVLILDGNVRTFLFCYISLCLSFTCLKPWRCGWYIFLTFSEVLTLWLIYFLSLFLNGSRWITSWRASRTWWANTETSCWETSELIETRM